MRIIIGKYYQKWLIIGVQKNERTKERLEEVESFVTVARNRLNKKKSSGIAIPRIQSIELYSLAGSTIIAIPMQQVELIDEAGLAKECRI